MEEARGSGPSKLQLDETQQQKLFPDFQVLYECGISLVEPAHFCAADKLATVWLIWLVAQLFVFRDVGADRIVESISVT
ncbi:hypothetical protein EVAR_23808_1 [Eumeta japonica]|uniref:Uncharacterized protein n=1 Tax=Eumeta variegata TaxID=151549 RepID=A0A4C1VM82_EUMVA|nr:hypothetical protein EVAR_23808_1 [Eumeta japonica]